MGWPVTELYRDVKSPWARQRNPIWRPLLGGDNSAPASSSAAVRRAMRSPQMRLRLSRRVRGDYRFRTPPPPRHVHRVFYVFIKRVQEKRELTIIIITLVLGDSTVVN